MFSSGLDDHGDSSKVCEIDVILKRGKTYPMFGFPMHYPNTKLLADFLFDSMEYIYQQRVEGLFRKTGSMERVGFLRKELDKGKMIEVEKQTPHDMTSLLKLFFRELPGSLIPPEHQEDILNASFLPEDEGRNEQLVRLLLKIPPHLCMLLKQLVWMLHLLSDNDVVEVTKMGPSNFSLIFNMVIIHQSKKNNDDVSIVDPSSIFKLTQRSSNLVIVLIENYRDIFMDIFPKDRPKEKFITELTKIRNEEIKGGGKKNGPNESKYHSLKTSRQSRKAFEFRRKVGAEKEIERLKRVLGEKKKELDLRRQKKKKTKQSKLFDEEVDSDQIQSLLENRSFGYIERLYKTIEKIYLERKEQQQNTEEEKKEEEEDKEEEKVPEEFDFGSSALEMVLISLATEEDDVEKRKDLENLEEEIERLKKMLEETQKQQKQQQEETDVFRPLSSPVSRIKKPPRVTENTKKRHILSSSSPSSLRRPEQRITRKTPNNRPSKPTSSSSSSSLGLKKGSGFRPTRGFLRQRGRRGRLRFRRRGRGGRGRGRGGRGNPRTQHGLVSTGNRPSPKPQTRFVRPTVTSTDKKN